MVRWPGFKILWMVLLGSTAALSHRFALTRHPLPPRVRSRAVSVKSADTLSANWLNIPRGGQQLDIASHNVNTLNNSRVALDIETSVASDVATVPVVSSSIAMLPLTLLHQCSQFYAGALQSHPIRTKSITAGCIFALSDLLAQRLDKGRASRSSTSKPSPLQWSRIAASAAVGLLYFGPAAHFWYQWIFRLLPGTSLISTLQKAALGQLIFGPTFTCIFFATSLIQSRTFSLSSWVRKIRTDLPGAWLAGVGFWPLVDLISYSLIAPQWIPLFVNMCSLVWTTYLALKAYAKK
jgi:protein Mpv17